MDPGRGTALADPAVLIFSGEALPFEASLLFLPLEGASESYLSVRFDALLSRRDRDRLGVSDANFAPGAVQTGGEVGSAMSCLGARPIEETMDARFERLCEVDIVNVVGMNEKTDGSGRSKWCPVQNGEHKIKGQVDDV